MRERIPRYWNQCKNAFARQPRARISNVPLLSSSTVFLDEIINKKQSALSPKKTCLLSSLVCPSHFYGSRIDSFSGKPKARGRTQAQWGSEKQLRKYIVSLCGLDEEFKTCPH